MSDRLVGLDLLRTLAFGAIVVFHLCWSFWPDGTLPDSFIWNAGSSFAWQLCASGFFIAFLTSLLHGRQSVRRPPRAWLFAFLLAGWLLFCAFQAVHDLLFGGQTVVLLSWDIYPLLALGLLTVALASRSTFGVFVLGAVGFLLLWIPFWEFEGKLGLSFQAEHVLLGKCPDDYADWPILPWIGIPWLGFALGRLLPESRLARFSWKEGVLWFFLLALTAPLLGTYARSPIGTQWACYVFRQPPIEFWAHMVWFSFFVRLSFVSRIQNFLARKPFLWISTLSLNRHFWIAYLIHFALVFGLTVLRNHFGWPQKHWSSDLSLLLLLPATEFATRAIINWPTFLVIALKKY